MTRKRCTRSMSDLLAQHPGLFDDEKVNLVDRGLKVIDALPVRYSGVKTLFLSKNAIRSLDGVQQFRRLRTLSVADNCMAHFDALDAATACKDLQAINLDGNPLCLLPYYRAHVIAKFPGLGSLDGKHVTEAERHQALQIVVHAAALLAVMLQNACLVHRLGRCLWLMKLHTELRQVMWRHPHAVGKAALPQIVSGDAMRLVTLWERGLTLTAQERCNIEHALLREVSRQNFIHVKRGSSDRSKLKWDAAFAKVMMAQQASIATLLNAVQAVQADAAKVVADICDQDPADCLRQGESDVETRLQRHREDREQLIHELRDHRAEAAGSPVASRHHSPGSRSVTGQQSSIPRPRRRSLSSKTLPCDPRAVEPQSDAQQTLPQHSASRNSFCAEPGDAEEAERRELEPPGSPELDNERFGDTSAAPQSAVGPPQQPDAVEYTLRGLVRGDALASPPSDAFHPTGASAAVARGHPVCTSWPGTESVDTRPGGQPPTDWPDAFRPLHHAADDAALGQRADGHVPLGLAASASSVAGLSDAPSGRSRARARSHACATDSPPRPLGECTRPYRPAANVRPLPLRSPPADGLAQHSPPRGVDRVPLQRSSSWGWPPASMDSGPLPSAVNPGLHSSAITADDMPVVAAHASDLAASWTPRPEGVDAAAGPACHRPLPQQRASVDQLVQAPAPVQASTVEGPQAQHVHVHIHNSSAPGHVVRGASYMRHEDDDLDPLPYAAHDGPRHSPFCMLEAAGAEARALGRSPPPQLADEASAPAGACVLRDRAPQRLVDDAGDAVLKYAEQVGWLTGHAEELTAAVEMQTAKAAALEAALASAREQAQQERDRHQAEQQALIERQRQELEALRTAYAGDVTKLEDEIVRLKVDESGAQGERQRLETRLRNAERQLEGERQQSASLAAQVAALRVESERLAEVSTVLESARAEAADLQRQLAAARDEATRSAEQLVLAEAALDAQAAAAEASADEAARRQALEMEALQEGWEVEKQLLLNQTATSLRELAAEHQETMEQLQQSSHAHIARLEGEIAEREAVERRQRLIAALADRCVLRSGWLRFRCAVQQAKRQRLQTAKADKLRRWRIQRTVFWGWQARSCQSRRVSQLQAVHRHRLLANVVSSWRLAVARLAMERTMEAAADVQWETYAIARAFGSWRRHVLACRLADAEGAPKRLLAEAHHRRDVMTWAWDAWLHALARAAPKRAKLRRAIRKASRSLCLRALRAWRKALELAQAQAVEVRGACEHHATALLRRAWHGWAQELALAGAARALSRAHQLRTKRAVLLLWRAGTSDARADALERRRGAQAWARLQSRRSLACWRTLLSLRRLAVERELAASRHFRGRLVVRAWHAWRRRAALLADVKRFARVSALAAARTAWFAWQQHVAAQKRQRCAEAKAERAHRRRQLRCMHAAFCAWRCLAREQQARRGERDAGLARRAMDAWKGAVHQAVVTSEQRMLREVGALEAELAQTREALRNSHAEGESLRGHVTHLSGKVGQLERDTADKERDVGALRSRLRECVVARDAADAAARALEARALALTREVERLGADLAAALEQRAAIATASALERDALNAQVATLESQLASAQSDLEQARSGQQRQRAQLDAAVQQRVQLEAQLQQSEAQAAAQLSSAAEQVSALRAHFLAAEHALHGQVQTARADAETFRAGLRAAEEREAKLMLKLRFREVTNLQPTLKTSAGPPPASHPLAAAASERQIVGAAQSGGGHADASAIRLGWPSELAAAAGPSSRAVDDTAARERDHHEGVSVGERPDSIPPANRPPPAELSTLQRDLRSKIALVQSLCSVTKQP